MQKKATQVDQPETSVGEIDRKDDPGESTSKQVRAWLEELGWTVDEQPPVEGLAWRLRARHAGGGQGVSAFQTSARPDQVHLTGAVAPDGPHPAKLGALPPAVMRNFLWDLRFELLRQRFQFSIQGPGVKRVLVRRSLYWDEGVARSQFVEAVEEIHRGVLTVQWMIQRLLDESPPPETFKVVGFDTVN